MTHSNYSLRPEDFRFAWANAYQLAMVHVAEMQRCIDDQLKVGKELIQLSAEQTELSRSNLHKTASVIIQELRRAGLESEKRINDATLTLVEHAQAMADRDAALRAETEKMTQKLARERQEFERNKRALMDQPLVLRLWCAFKYKG